MSNPLDWQYNPVTPSRGLSKLVKTMKAYHTSNMDFHGGDPYDHSVWTALWTELYILRNSRWWMDVPNVLAGHGDFLEALKSATVMAAFMHDVGKFGDGILFFYNKEKHPEDGAKYLLGINPFTHSDGEKVILNVELMHDFDEWQIRYFAWISAGHYDFGNSMKELTNDNAHNERVAQRYINLSLKRLTESGLDHSQLLDAHIIALVLSLICISVSDVKATMPPPNDTDIIDKITSYVSEGGDLNAIDKQNWNLQSSFYPFISNTAREYRGKDAYKDFGYEERGMLLMQLIKGIFMVITGGDFQSRKIIF